MVNSCCKQAAGVEGLRLEPTRQRISYIVPHRVLSNADKVSR